VHIHAREDNGSPSFRVDRYREIMEAIRERSPVIINFSTGAVGVPMEERVAHIRDLKPDIGALNMGSMNYAKYSSRTKSFYFDFVFQNPFSDIISLLKAMKKGGVKPELECFDVGHIGNAAPLIDMGLLERPLQFSLILGVLGGIPPTAENLVHLSRQVPIGSTWEVIGISHPQWRLVATALALGGNIRVGLEDNLYVSPGVMAKSNAELVEKAVRMTEDVGRRPATVKEARDILSLPPM